jgi:hypothetical protein
MDAALAAGCPHGAGYPWRHPRFGDNKKVWLQAIGVRSYAEMMNVHQKEGGLVAEDTMWET